MTCVRLEYTLAHHRHICHKARLAKHVLFEVRTFQVASIIGLIGNCRTNSHLQIFAHFQSVTHSIGRHATTQGFECLILLAEACLIDLWEDLAVVGRGLTAHF